MMENNKTAQVPYPIVQSQMFVPTNAPITPYSRKWVDILGNKNSLLAPSTPTHYDMVNFVAFLHLAQQKFTPKEDMPEDYNDRYDHCKVILKMSDFYSLLNLPTNGTYRKCLDDSLEKMSRVSLAMQYAEPEKHNGNTRISIPSLTGSLIWNKQPGKANILIAHPIKDMIYNPALTVDLNALIQLKNPIAKCTAFFMQARQASTHTWKEWMYTVSGAKIERRFKEHFRESLAEMKDSGYYDIKIEGNRITIKRLSAKIYQL